MKEETKTKYARITLKLTVLSFITIYTLTALHTAYASPIVVLEAFGSAMTSNQRQAGLAHYDAPANHLGGKDTKITTNKQRVLTPLANEDESLEVDIEAIIGVKAKEYGVDAKLMYDIAMCESRLDHNAINWQGSSASGLFQFTIGTWQDGVRWRGLDWTLEDRFDPWKSADMAGYFMGERGEYSRWACLKLI